MADVIADTMRKAFILLLLSQFPLVVPGLTTTNSNLHHRIWNFVQIVGLPGGGTQSLPTNYVQNHIRRWQVNDDDGTVGEDVCQQSDVNLQTQWTPTLQYRPVLEFLIKGGVPSYVIAGLQLRDLDLTQQPITVRPLARQWTTIQFAVEPNFRIELFQYQHQLSDDERRPDGSKSIDQIAEWKLGDQQPAKLVKRAMELFGLVTSELKNDSGLLEGFSIVSVPLPVAWSDVPRPPSGGWYTVACMATAEPDAQELLTLDQDLLEMTASSLLEMIIIGPNSEDVTAGEL